MTKQVKKFPIWDQLSYNAFATYTVRKSLVANALATLVERIHNVTGAGSFPSGDNRIENHRIEFSKQRHKKLDSRLISSGALSAISHLQATRAMLFQCRRPK